MKRRENVPCIVHRLRLINFLGKQAREFSQFLFRKIIYIITSNFVYSLEKYDEAGVNGLREDSNLWYF